MSRAARSRKYRKRLQAGRVVLRVEVDHVALTEDLIAVGLLTRQEADDDDREKLAAAVSKFLKLVSPSRVTPRDF